MSGRGPASGPFPGPLAGRRLYLCTPDRPDLESFLDACICGGTDVVQLRDKRLNDRALVARALLAARVCRDRGVPFLVNDRCDVALAAGADGAHVGQDDVSPALARRVLGDAAIIGLSTHSPEDLAATIGEPVDYVSAGPVSPTPTKPGRPGVGLAYITHAVEHAGRPVWVTGGASPATVAAMVTAGARHIVAVRWLTEAADPTAAARQLRGAIDAAIDAAEAAFQASEIAGRATGATAGADPSGL